MLGAILLSQWMNPCCDIKEEEILSQLDLIAEAVALELWRTHGGNSVKEESYLEDEEERNGSTPKCCRLESDGTHELLPRVVGLHCPAEDVLDALNMTLYNTLGFKSGPRERYYDLNNSFIDKVFLCNQPS